MTEEVRIGGEYMAQTEPSRRERDQKTTDPLSVYQANGFSYQMCGSDVHFCGLD